MTNTGQVGSAVRTGLRKGWCPGALRPMQTGDGLLVRVKPRAGTFSVDALKVIANAAQSFGNGHIDLTNRANLQIRGVSEAALPSVLDALSSAGLLDETPEAEAVRNVVVNPVSGITNAAHDVRPLAREIETALAMDEGCHALPPKFGIGVSGPDAPKDWCGAGDIAVSIDGQGQAILKLDGDERIVARCPSSAAVSAIIAVTRAFADLHAANPSIRRMRDAVHAEGAAALCTAAGLKVALDEPPQSVSPKLKPGVVSNGRAAVIGLPFGRAEAQALSALLSEIEGITDVRLSPQRMMVVVTNHSNAAADVMASAERLGFIVRNNDPRLMMDVCTGAPACTNATTATRDDAAKLATYLSASCHPARSIHISGCAKGCARRAAADFTFVARDGVYDLIQNGDVGGPITKHGIAPGELAGALA